MCRLAAWRRSTTGWRRANCSAPNTWSRFRISQGGFDPDVVLGPGSPITVGAGLHAQPARVAGPNLRSFGHGGSGGSYGFVDLENRIGYAYVMNYFDATKCNADPAAPR